MKRMNKTTVFSAALTMLAVICISATALPTMAKASGPVVYFADAGENPGSVYKVENGTESTYFTRTAGQLFNLAFSPDGILYYSNSNDYDLYRLQGGEETLVYHHTTYLRDVAFDFEGSIYFSESHGGGGDGYIYRLEDGVASLYYTVLLSNVGGFWVGDFTFDQDGNLYLSNGNTGGAKIYQVEDGVPQIVFSAPSNESIKGISFKTAGILLYANWHGDIYEVDLSNGDRKVFYSNSSHSHLSDVFVELATITGTVMYNGNPVTDYTNEPASFWARDENTGQVLPISPHYNTSDGTYSIPNVPPGEYGISVWIDDAEPFDGRPLPGDYRGWNSPVVVPAGQPVVNKDLPCEKTIHLTAPVDNLSEIGHLPPPYDTYYQQEMFFRWDAITEASSYQIIVYKYQSSPYQFIETVYSEDTPNTQTTIVLDDSLENQHYVFHLYATNSSELLVGKLMVVYSNGCGWDYRFRVLSGGGPCAGDFDGDGDVDGSDLAVLAANPDLLDLSVFASGFGKTDCPITVILNSTSGLDGFVTSWGSAVTWSEIMVGDSSANVSVRGFLSFDISSIPPTAHMISATLRAYQKAVTGTPYADLGNVIVDHLDYGTTLDGTDYDLSALQSNVGTLSDNSTIEYKTLDVTTRVEADINDGRSRSQYRLLFYPTPTDSDSLRDAAFFTSAYAGTGDLPELVITYELPTAP